MDDLLSSERHANLIRNLFRAAAERAQREAEIGTSFQRRARDAAEQHQEERQQLTQRHAADSQRLESEYHRSVQNVTAQGDGELTAAERAYSQAEQAATDEFENEQQAATKKLEEGKWEAAALFDATKNQLEGQLTPKLNLVAEQGKRLGELQLDLNRLRQELKLSAAADSARRNSWPSIQPRSRSPRSGRCWLRPKTWPHGSAITAAIPSSRRCGWGPPFWPCGSC